MDKVCWICRDFSWLKEVRSRVCVCKVIRDCQIEIKTNIPTLYRQILSPTEPDVQGVVVLDVPN